MPPSSSRRLFYLQAFLTVAVPSAASLAALLPPPDYRVTDPSGQRLTRAADNNLASSATVVGSELEGLWILIDLRRTCVIHRVFLTGGRSKKMGGRPDGEGSDANTEEDGGELAPYPEELTIFVDNNPNAETMAAKYPLPKGAGTHVRFEADVCFRPTGGRYVRLFVAEKGRGLSWSVTELEVYGFADASAAKPDGAVLVEPDAPFPLQLAAQDLSYYLGELTGKPVLIDSPRATNKYPGVLYEVAAPPALPPYEELVRQAPRDYEKVTVRREGRRVRFEGAVTRSVLFGVYHFLDAQGVRWVYPGPHGDFVPRTGSVDLTMLPLEHSPPIKTRHFSTTTQKYYSTTNAIYLWVWRNRWNSTWGGEYRRIIGSLPRPRKRPYLGHPHSLATLVPGRLFEKHPDWFPFFREDSLHASRIAGKAAWKAQPLGQRVPYGTPWGLNPCLGNPAVAEYVAQRIVDITEPRGAQVRYTVSPMDAGIWCECDRCRELDVVMERDPLVGWGDRIISDRYFTFIKNVAERIAPTLPNARILALAYNDYHRPPTSIGKLPPNVLVDVCQYFRDHNLPTAASPRNREMRTRMETWRTRARHLGVYDYSLLYHGDAKLPIPLVSALADRFGLYRSLNVEYLELEATFDASLLPYNPWNLYAYNRLLYPGEQSAERILHDFFAMYYAEAATPMLAFYRTIEDHLTTHRVSLGFIRRQIPPGAFPVAILSTLLRHLDDAERRASYWVLRRRIAAAREGIDHVIKGVGLDGVDLTDASVFPSAGVAGDSTTLDLKALRIRKQYVYPHRSTGWIFGAHGTLGTHVRFTEAGAYRVSVTARAVPYEGVWPTLTVHVGPRRSAPTDVSSKDDQVYTFRIDEVPAGIWQCVLVYRNSATGGRRRVYVSDITVARK